MKNKFELTYDLNLETQEVYNLKENLGYVLEQNPIWLSDSQIKEISQLKKKLERAYVFLEQTHNRIKEQR